MRERSKNAARTGRHVFLQSLSRRSTRGTLVLGSLRLKCALGRSGVRATKREGDGATPLGIFSPRLVFYRPDRVRRPRTGLPVRRNRPCYGWCDDASDRNYNRLVPYPYPRSAEELWRADALYDVVVVLGYNDAPRIKGLGSAIFMHLAKEGYQPTAGCLALEKRDLLRLLSFMGRQTRVSTLPGQRRT